MGNWRTVQIVGTCGEQDIPALSNALTVDRDYKNFHCLSHTGGLAGLPDWARTKFDCVGNLAERDYDVEDVARQLGKLAAIAPSLTLKIHCGGDYEDKQCIATIALANGQVAIGEPEIETIAEISEHQIAANFFESIARWHQDKADDSNAPAASGESEGA